LGKIPKPKNRSISIKDASVSLKSAMVMVKSVLNIPGCQNVLNVIIVWKSTNGVNTLKDCVAKDAIISLISIASQKKSWTISQESLLVKLTSRGCAILRKSSLGLLGYAMNLGYPLRDISKNFYFELGIKVSNVTIIKWSRKFACLFSQYTDKVSLKLSKTWHIDETVIKINGKKHWIYVVLCHKSRFVIAWYLSKTRSIEAAVKVLRLAIEKAGFKPNRLISDRHLF